MCVYVLSGEKSFYTRVVSLRVVVARVSLLIKTVLLIIASVLYRAYIPFFAHSAGVKMIRYWNNF